MNNFIIVNLSIETVYEQIFAQEYVDIAVDV
jgi:hypothetical protein